MPRRDRRRGEIGQQPVGILREVTYFSLPGLTAKAITGNASQQRRSSRRKRLKAKERGMSGAAQVAELAWLRVDGAS